MAMGAKVTLGGAEIDSRWDGLAPVALAGIEFTWGRQRVFDPSDPGTAKLSLIDRTGEWASRRDLNGVSVRIDRTGPSRAMFTGSVSTAVATRVRLRNPRSGAYEDVWRVDLTASSTLAAGAAAVLTGISTETTREGLGGWNEINSRARTSGTVSSPIARGGLAIFPGGIQEVAQEEIVPGVTPRQASVDASKAATILELTEQVYRNLGLCSVEFDPATMGIVPGRWADAKPVALVRSGGRVVLQLSGGRVVPARLVGLPAGSGVQSTVAESIDVVQITYEYYTRDPQAASGTTRYAWLSQLLQKSTARASTGTRRVLKLDSGMITLDPSLFTSGNPEIPKYNAAPPWVLTTAVNIVNKVNGQLRLPPIVFDDRRMPLDAATTEQVYTPITSTVPLYFAGSVFNALENAGPQHQIIGGTFRFDKGWTHTAQLGPALTGSTSSLTLGQLFSRSSAPLSTYDPTITLGDFERVTQGLTS